MRIAFYGSSLLSSYWNGAATYYRGLIRALDAIGYEVTFYEPDAYGRQEHRDIEPPSWCRVEVYPASEDAARNAAARAVEADIVVKASGVGVFDDELLRWTMEAARPDALRIWWDVDAPATLAEMRRASDHPVRCRLRSLDAVLTYGGGAPVAEAYEGLGARLCVPIYNALDVTTHFPVGRDRRFEADLGFLGNRLPDREARVAELFIRPARAMPLQRFLLGGSGWDQLDLPANVHAVGHVPTADHNAFNATPRAVLNISRESMAEMGFSPATRVFEAAGAAACLMTDSWPGIELFLTPDDEVLVVRDGRDVAEALAGLDADRARTIGARACARIRRDHTYDRRAAEADILFRRLLADKRAGAAA